MCYADLGWQCKVTVWPSPTATHCLTSGPVDLDGHGVSTRLDKHMLRRTIGHAVDGHAVNNDLVLADLSLHGVASRSTRRVADRPAIGTACLTTASAAEDRDMVAAGSKSCTGGPARDSPSTSTSDPAGIAERGSHRQQPGPPGSPAHGANERARTRRKRCGRRERWLTCIHHPNRHSSRARRHQSQPCGSAFAGSRVRQVHLPALALEVGLTPLQSAPARACQCEASLCQGWV